MSSLNVETSINILKQRIDQWAKVKQLDSYLYIDSRNLPELSLINKFNTAIIFGDFLASFLFLIEKNAKIKTVYVLCQKAKLILESLELKSKIKIEVINRYDLFPKTNPEKDFPDIFNDEVSLTYSGRITQSKNIIVFLNFAHQLQLINPQIKVKIFGEFDDFLNIDFNRKDLIYSYQQLVEDYIKKLEWVSEPTLIHGLSEKEWVLKLDDKDLLVNFSTYWMDDFSVSVAQAQELGFPILCLDIGGLSDISGKNIITLPAYLLNSEHVNNSFELDSVKAKNCIEYIRNYKEYKASKVESPEEKVKPPLFKSIKLNQVYDYINTYDGKSFFKNYFKTWYQSNVEARKILFLVSSEQNHWLSLKVVAEHVKIFWLAYQQRGYVIEMLDVDQAFDKKIISKINSYEFIVAPSLSQNTIKVLKLLRDTFGFKKSIIAYTYELASVFYSSLKLRELSSFFNEKDFLITQCISDFELTKLSFENPNVKLIPTCFVVDKVIKPQDYEVKNLNYIGRISEQKGLHFLLWSLSLIREQLRDKNIKLNIFGVHDHFGMPNWGDGGGLYLDFLGDLTEELSLSDIVVFHGFKSYDNWGKFIKSKQGVGIFPSLHSDENFGIAPFDLLNEGVPVLLTKWGGFQDLKKYYDPIVSHTNVYNSSIGPYIDVNEFARDILKFIKNVQVSKEFFISKLEINDWVKKTNFEPCNSSTKLKFSKIASEIIDNLKYSRQIPLRARGWALNGSVYSSCSDRHYLLACKQYGALLQNNVVEQDYILAPWVQLHDSKFLVNDPIKGNFTVDSLDKLFELGLAFKKSF